MSMSDGDYGGYAVDRGDLAIAVADAKAEVYAEIANILRTANTSMDMSRVATALENRARETARMGSGMVVTYS